MQYKNLQKIFEKDMRISLELSDVSIKTKKNYLCFLKGEEYKDTYYLIYMIPFSNNRSQQF